MCLFFIFWIMKTIWNIYMDDFLLEKVVSQGIWTKMTRKYTTIFRPLLANPYVDPDELSTYTTKNFKRFLGDCLIRREWSSSTYNCYRKCLRCYCEFLKTEGYLTENPIDAIKERIAPKQLPKTLSSTQLNELFESLKDTFDETTFHWSRNAAIVYTFVHTGLRLSELTSLKLTHLRLHDGYLKVVKWKWNKDRTVPLSNQIIKLLLDYLRARRVYFTNDEDEYLFPAVKANCLYKSASRWNQLWDRDMRAIIQKIRYNVSFHFTWHQLRHTFATELVRNNFDIYNISRILWHADVNTTKIYLSVDTDRLKKQLDHISMFENISKQTTPRTMVVA